MNLEKVCYGCFREKEPGVCPYCGYDDTEEQPFLALPPGTILNGRYMAGSRRFRDYLSWVRPDAGN